MIRETTNRRRNEQDVHGLVWDYAARDWRAHAVNDQAGSGDVG